MRASRTRWIGVLALGFATASLVASPVAVQRITGQIAGTVTDESGAVLPGVTATLTGEKIVGTKTTVSNERGFYRFIALPPGVYDLSLNLDGFAPTNKTGVRVSLGASTEVDAALRVGELAEAITVVADAPVIDTTSNEVGTNFGREWVDNAPVARQSFNDLVASAPGSLRASDQSRRTMVYGSSYDENSFQLDGADVNDNFFNEQLAEPNIDAIEEVEVLSLGAPAEYGNLTGAVYNIVTRQGTNRFKGDASFYTQSDSLTDRNTDDDEDDGFPFEREEYTDYTAQLGGPIVKDKVWFFGSFQRQEDEVLTTGSDPSVGSLAVFSSTFDRIFAKVNVQLTDGHDLVATFHQDESDESGGLGLDQAPTTATGRTGKTPTPGIGYTGVLSDRTLLEVRATGFYGEVFLGPADPNQAPDLGRFVNDDTGFISGGHYYFYDLEPERTTVNAKVSHLADEFLGGGHEFRFGVQYNESEAGGLYGYNDLVFTYGERSGPGIPPNTQYGYGYTRVPFSYSGNAEGWGFFIDDTWRANDRLTINLGARYDSNKAFSREQTELGADGNPTGVVFPETEYYTWEYFSPRFGFNYLLTDDGKTVLKGHIGRYHRAITTGEFANVIGPSIKPIFAGTFDTLTNQFGDLSQITDNANLSVDPSYDSPRTDQFILSLERQFGRNWGVNLNVVHKRGRDFAAWRDLTGVYETVQWIDGDFDLDGVVDIDPSTGQQVDPNATGRPIDVQRRVTGADESTFQITNRSEMDTDIWAASIEVNRPMADNWSLGASLTWLQSEGRTPDSAGGVSAAQRGGLQFRNFGRNPNDFVNTGGRLRGDLPWQFKTQFVYQLPKGFLVAADVSVRSGANRVRRVTVPRELTGIRSTILAQERGTFGRVPTQKIVNLRVEKSFSLGSDVSLAIIADIFNALNDDAYETVRSSIGTSTVFNQPAGFVLPRRAQVGVKLRF